MYKSGIYQIKNLQTGKVYIGSSVNVYRRLLEHKLYLKNGKHHSIYLQRSWNKYGKKNFEFSTLEVVKPSRKVLVSREQYYLDLNVGNLYNSCPFAYSCAGRRLTAIHKLRIGKSNKGNILQGRENPFYGKHHTNKTKELLRQSSLGNKNCVGKHLTTKTKLLISKSKKGSIPWNKGKKGLMTAWNKGKNFTKHPSKASEIR